MTVDDRDLTAKAARGSRAQELLGNPLMGETFEAMERAYVTAWRNTRPEQATEREHLWTLMALLADFRGHLTKTVNDGKLALDEFKRRERNRKAPVPPS